MVAAREVDQKGKFMANSNKAARDVRSRDRARIPCIQKDQDCLKSHTDRVTLVANNFQPFVRYQLMRSTIIRLWFAPDRTWQLIFNRLIALQQTPKNLLSLSRTIV